MSILGETVYSDEIGGTRGNYQWPVRFDLTDGFLGVTQKNEAGEVKDRVLLSPKQLDELLAFLKRHRAPRR